MADTEKDKYIEQMFDAFDKLTIENYSPIMNLQAKRMAKAISSGENLTLVIKSLQRCNSIMIAMLNAMFEPDKDRNDALKDMMTIEIDRAVPHQSLFLAPLLHALKANGITREQMAEACDTTI